MGRASYAWRQVCESALRESDPKKLIASIERAITLFERRHAEWGSNPGTPDELSAIRRTIAGLERRLKEEFDTYGAVEVSRAAAGTSSRAKGSIAIESGNVKRLLLVLRSTPLNGKQMIHKSK
jgi:hypothetical protein